MEIHLAVRPMRRAWSGKCSQAYWQGRYPVKLHRTSRPAPKIFLHSSCPCLFQTISSESCLVSSCLVGCSGAKPQNASAKPKRVDVRYPVAALSFVFENAADLSARGGP